MHCRESYNSNTVDYCKVDITIISTQSLTAIKLRIFPFALSLSKGEWKNHG